jgi:hypothetical protein
VGRRESLVGDGKLEEGSAGCVAGCGVASASLPAHVGSLKGRVGDECAWWSIARAHRAGLHFQGAGRRWVETDPGLVERGRR